VLDLEERVLAWVRVSDGFVPDVFAGLNRRGRVVEVAFGVQIKVDGMVA